MQNYKLIKDYPGAPPIGYITNFNHNEEDWGAPNVLIVHDCENYPEFWEKTNDVIVYTPEAGEGYTYNRIIELAKGNQMYADLLISRATWEYIETMIEEDLQYGEITEQDGTYVLTDWGDEEE